MKMPSGLLGAALLLWGWQLGEWWLGAICAGLLEAPAWIPWRWPLAARLERQLGVLCQGLGAGLLVLGVVVGVRRDIASGISTLIAWLPLLTLVPAVLERWGEGAVFDSLSLLPSRWRAGRQMPRLSGAWLSWGVCLFAASVVPGAPASASTMAWFYPALCSVLAWGLWHVRPRGRPVWRWLLPVASAAALGFGFHLGLHHTQGALEEAFGDWFMAVESGGEPDPMRTSTAIGRIGKLKLSDAIVLRVKFAGPAPVPLLLREARYDYYSNGSWLAARPQERRPGLQGGVLSFADAGRVTTQRMTIRLPLRQGKGLLALPDGTVAVQGLAGLQVSQTRLGAVQIENAPARLDYRVEFVPGATLDKDAAGELDLDVPPALRRQFAEEARDWGLAGLPAGDAAARILARFQRDFRYSLIQRARGEQMPLAFFMRQSHAGHCEYFATATVMLLRSAGIPARYATGYSLQEYSALEGAYVARARHAHAWAQFHDGEGWRDLDTTPARWAEIESENGHPAQILLDLAAWALDRGMAVWSRIETGHLLPLAACALLPWLIWSLWRLFRARRTPVSAPDRTMPKLARQGLDSDWYRLEPFLAQQGLARLSGELRSAWLQRMQRIAPDCAAALADLCRLHERHRFDPQGLSDGERALLRRGVDDLLRQLPPHTPG